MKPALKFWSAAALLLPLSLGCHHCGLGHSSGTSNCCPTGTGVGYAATPTYNATPSPALTPGVPAMSNYAPPQTLAVPHGVPSYTLPGAQ